MISQDHFTTFERLVENEMRLKGKRGDEENSIGMWKIVR